MLAEVFTRSRWLLLFRGVAAGTFGILVLSWPHLTLATLALLFGVYTLVEGTSTVIGARLKLTVCADPQLIGVQGLAGVAIGLIVIGHPGLAASYLVIQIALWTAAIGGIDAIVGLVLLEETGSEWLLLLSGIVPALLGALVLTQLGVGTLGARYYLAISSISASVLLLALVFRLRAYVGRQ